MGIEVTLRDGRGQGQAACVTKRGELIINKPDYSTAYAVTASVNNTAYNFIGPIVGKQFVITDILIYANKGVGVNDASVQLYEADDPTETTSTKDIIDVEMVKQTARDITGLNLIVTKGKWVNIKTDDNTIFATLMGFYVNAD